MHHARNASIGTRLLRPRLGHNAGPETQRNPPACDSRLFFHPTTTPSDAQARMSAGSVKVGFDEQSDALYLLLDQGPVAESEEVHPGAVLDYDEFLPPASKKGSGQEERIDWCRAPRAQTQHLRTYAEPPRRNATEATIAPEEAHRAG